MPFTEEQLAEIYPEPDGYMLTHSRGSMGSTCSFGPFKTMDELREWHERVGKPAGVHAGIVPLYLTVDWRR